MKQSALGLCHLACMQIACLKYQVWKTVLQMMNTDDAHQNSRAFTTGDVPVKVTVRFLQALSSVHRGDEWIVSQSMLSQFSAAQSR